MRQKLVISLVFSLMLVFTFFVSAETVESFQFEKASNKLNLGESLSDFTNKLDDNDFPRFLGDLSLEGYDYSQEIVMGDLVFENFSNSRYNDGEYTLGLEINRGDAILNYTLEFRDYPALEFLEQKQIYFLGREYTIIETSLEDKNMTLQDSEGNLLDIRSGRDMEFNGDNLNDVMAELVLEGDNVSRIVVPWVADDRYFVTEESDLSLQSLGSFRFRFDGMYEIEEEQIGNISLEVINYDEQVENLGSFSCYDSDDGDYYTRGIAEGNLFMGLSGVNETNGSYEDYCYDSENIMEYKCYTETSEYDVLFGETYIREVSTICLNGCEDGACLEEDEEESNESTTCTDTEEGVDYYVKGEVNYENTTFSDFCWYYSDTLLKERYCDSSGKLNEELYECPNGCSEGACVVDEGDNNQSCSSGCLFEEDCVSIGYRTNNTFCDIGGDFSSQKNEEGVCENDFECLSNSCIDGTCVEKGFWTKIFDWFRSLFGGN
jgi:hypothetical protein